MAVVNRYFD